MISAALPQDEARRLEALQRYDILDSISEQTYDDLLAIAAGICGTSMGAVTLVDAQRQWFKANKGLPVDETPRDIAFCAHAILTPDELFVVPDALADVRFFDNPLVTGHPNIRFYAGAPLVLQGGEAVGTLCVIDDSPHDITPFQKRALEGLSRQLVALLELRMAHKELRGHLAEREWYERELQRSHEQLEQENAQLSEMSRTDPLTGLVNRRVFNSTIDNEFVRAATGNTENTALAMAVIDIDHFKAINDTHGHPAGDAVLVAVAQCLRAHCAPGATVARFGGEEFAILLHGEDAHDIGHCCEVLRAAIESLHMRARVTVSIGVSVLRTGDSVGDLYSRADEALYAAKRSGRNRVVVA